LAESELPGQRATSVQGVAIHPGRNAERALEGLGAYPRIEVLYWMHQARRDPLIH
jgi:tRNA (Thr-GGU) A37 N-methylase